MKLSVHLKLSIKLTYKEKTGNVVRVNDPLTVVGDIHGYNHLFLQF